MLNLFRKNNGDMIPLTESDISPYCYLQTKWLRAKETIPQKLMRFLWISDNQLVAMKSDVVHALRIAYECGLKDKKLHEIEKNKQEALVL